MAEPAGSLRNFMDWSFLFAGHRLFIVIVIYGGGLGDCDKAGGR